MTSPTRDEVRAAVERLVAEISIVYAADDPVMHDLRTLIAAAEDGWIPVDERMPPSGAYVLAFYRNIYGHGRRIRARWVASCHVEASEDDHEDVVVEDDDGGLYLRSGWYESNEHDEVSYAVPDAVTHWMPLPAPPADSAIAAKGK